MKSLRIMLSVPLMLLSTMAFTQTQPAAQSQSQKPSQPQTDSQKAFSILKSLAGTWEGKPTLDTPLDSKHEDLPDLMQVSLRVTSRGNALMHEMTGKDKPSPTNTATDDPITMFYLDQDRLILTHFCDAGNRPRMVGRLSPDGKTVEFDFLDVSGKMLTHHMQHAKFTVIDANHHSEEWTFQMGDKLVHGRFDLQRVNNQEASAR